MKGATTKRATPTPPGRKQVVVRDLLVLGLIGDAWPVTTRQVADFVQVSRPIASRILRRLRDLGLVAVHVAGMETENRYTLTAPGARLLARTRGVDADAFATPRGLGLVRHHHATVVDLYVALRVAFARSKRLTLSRFVFEAELRRRVGSTKHALVPDAVAVTVGDDLDETAYAIEVDEGTENPSYVAREKFEAYAALSRAGLPLVDVFQWQVLVVVPSERRLRKLVEAAWDTAPPDGLLCFAVEGAIHDRDVLTAPWRTPRLHPSGKHLELPTISPFLPVTTPCDNGLHGFGVPGARNEAGFDEAALGPFVERGWR